MPRKKSTVTRPGIVPGTFRLVAQRLNHYATPGPYINGIDLNSQGQLSLYSDLFSGITWVMDWTTMKLLRTQES
jgi:hypothetical protein